MSKTSYTTILTIIVPLTTLATSFISTHPRFAHMHPKSIDSIDTIVTQAVSQEISSKVSIFAAHTNAVFYKSSFETKKKTQMQLSGSADDCCELKELGFFVGIMPSILLLIESGNITFNDRIDHVTGNTSITTIRDACNIYDYETLEKVIAIASKQSYAEFVDNKIFKPLEMTTTSVIDHTIRTSPQDLAQFGSMLLNKGMMGKTKILSSRTIDFLLTIMQSSPWNLQSDLLATGCMGIIEPHGNTLIIDTAHQMVCSIVMNLHNGKEQEANRLSRCITNILAGAIITHQDKKIILSSTGSRSTLIK